LNDCITPFIFLALLPPYPKSDNLDADADVERGHSPMLATASSAIHQGSAYRSEKTNARCDLENPMPGGRVRVIIPPQKQEVFAVDMEDHGEALMFIARSRAEEVQIFVDGKLNDETLSFLNVPPGEARPIV
jgi:hypothetical protein